MEKTVELNSCIVSRKKEFIYLEIKKIGRSITKEDAEEMLDCRINLATEPNEKQMVIADIRNAGQTDKGARSVAKTDKMLNHTKGLAL